MNESSSSSQPQGNRQPQSVQGYLIANKYEVTLLFTRLYIIVCTILYVFPIFGFEYCQTCFKRVLLGSAIVSALRMHQRLPRVQFNKEFVKLLVMEDSFHYLIYSLLFLASRPQTVALVPIAVFAVLHSASYLQKLVEAIGGNNVIATRIRLLTSKVMERNIQQSILTFIASTEIIIFPISIILLLGGQGSILIPFFYYRFLQFRYMSRRNPYSRLVFGQLRMKVEQIAYHQSCPGLARKVLLGMLSIASRLSPASMTAPAS